MSSSLNIVSRAQRRKAVRQTSLQRTTVTTLIPPFESTYALIHTAVAEWLRTRNVLPSQCFENLGLTSFRGIAQSFLGGGESSLKDRAPIAVGESSFLKIVRNKLQAADFVLSWLDAGMRNCREGYLGTLIIEIILDQTKPHQIYDGLILSIDGGTSGKSEPMSPRTMTAVQKDMSLIVKSLCESGENLEHLPDERYLRCYLLNNRPAPFLEHSVRHYDRELCSGLVAAGKVDCGTLNTGRNRVNIQVCTNTSDLRSPGLPSTISSQTFSSNPPLPKPRSQTSVPTNAAIQRLPTSRALLAARFNTEQTSSDATQSVTSSSVGKNPLLAMVLLPELEIDMEANGQLDGRIYRKPWPAQNKQIVDCECDCNKDKELIVQCEICSNYQHEICYGFKGERPSTQHYCYKCLLQGRDDNLFQKLVKMVRYRRAVWLVHDRGMPANTVTFKKHLNLGFDNATNMLERMWNDGFFDQSSDLGREEKPKLIGNPQMCRDNLWKPYAYLDRYYFYKTLNPTSTNLQQ